MSSLSIILIPPPLIDVVWSQVEPLIQLAADLTPEEVSMQYTHDSLVNGSMILLAVIDGRNIIAVNVLEVQVFATGLRALANTLVGGTRMEEWGINTLEIIKAIAKDLNCTEIRGFAARKGWMRKLAELGWDEIHTTVRYKL